MSQKQLYLLLAVAGMLIILIATHTFGVRTLSKAELQINVFFHIFWGALMGAALGLILIGLGKKSSKKENQKMFWSAVLLVAVAAPIISHVGWSAWKVIDFFRGTWL